MLERGKKQPFCAHSARRRRLSRPAVIRPSPYSVTAPGKEPSGPGAAGSDEPRREAPTVIRPSLCTRSPLRSRTARVRPVHVASCAGRRRTGDPDAALPLSWRLSPRLAHDRPGAGWTGSIRDGAASCSRTRARFAAGATLSAMPTPSVAGKLRARHALTARCGAATVLARGETQASRGTER